MSNVSDGMSFEATGETAVIIFFINKIEQEKESKR